MTTEVQQILPIPEDTIQGTGSYTIPANKYAKVTACVSSQSNGWIGLNNHYNTANQMSSGSSTFGHSINATTDSNTGEYDLVEGDSITVLSNTTDVSTNGNNYTDNYAAFRVNGTVVLRASSGASASWNRNSSGGSQMYVGVRTNQVIGWNASIYPIPKNNLPNELIEGN